MNNKIKVIVLYCTDPIISFDVKTLVKSNGISIKKAIVYVDMENGIIIIHDGDVSMNHTCFSSIYEELANMELNNINQLRLNISKDNINFDIVVINVDNQEN